MQLWNSSNFSTWNNILRRYPDALAYACSLKKTVTGRETLRDIDGWVWSDLASDLQKKHYCTLPQLIKLTEWKMTRGIWRPRNKQLVSSNDGSLVEELSKEAFLLISEDISNLKKAIGQLNKLKGVGPATSSALLACYCPSKVAFMSDEAVKCTSLPLSYTVKNYMEFNNRITRKQEELDCDLTVNDLQQALWCSVQCNKGKITVIEEEEENIPIKENKKRARPETKTRTTKRQKITNKRD